MEPQGRARRATIARVVLVATVAAALVAAWYPAILIGEKTWAAPQYRERVAPARQAAAEALWHREAPTWWDDGFGAPLALAPEHSAWYPGAWLARSLRGVDLVSLAHVWLLACAAMWLAARAAPGARGVWAGGLAALACVAAAGVWPAVVPAAAWASIALALAPALARPSPRAAWAAWALASALVALAGSPALALVAAVAVGVVVARTDARRLPAFSLAALVALALSAVQWLPSALAGYGAGPFLAGAALVALAVVGVALGAALSRLASRRAVVGVVVIATFAVGGGAALSRARTALSPAAWRARPDPFLSAAVSAERSAAPRRVYCPVPFLATSSSRARGAARVDPAAALATEAAYASSWRCVPARAAPLPWPQPILWQRGAGAAGRLLRRLSVAHAVVPSSTVIAAGFDELARDGAWSFVAAPARPMAAAYPSWKGVATHAAAVDAVLDDAASNAEVLVVEGDSERSADAAAEPCAVTRWRPGAVTMRCTAVTETVGAIALAWHPSWRVTVDGEPAALLRAEGMLLAVALPPGSHEVTWRFLPRGGRAAAALSLLAALAVLAALGQAMMRALAARRHTPANQGPSAP